MNTTGHNTVTICDGKIIDGAITGVKKSIKHPSPISKEEFLKLTEEFKDYLLYVEGTKTSSYDNSDDERAECSSHDTPFGRFYELSPMENSEHLLRIDGKIKGVVFFIKSGSDKFEYRPFLFDNSIKNTARLGYSASHSSSFTYIEKVSLVKKGENGVPETAKTINFIQSEMYPSI